MKIILGDSLHKLTELPTNSIDAIVTDAPYGLKFMQRKWDYDVPSVDLWKEALRVLKPGAHVLCFGGTRTYHRMVQNIEDAGFEVRDMLSWLYGSGFPKSLDVSKAIDKAAGAERKVVGQKWAERYPNGPGGNSFSVAEGPDGKRTAENTTLTAPATDDAKRWQGWGTALKPANEPIVLARKPLEKGLTVAQNVQKWGTGALNVDAGRIGMTKEDRAAVQAKANKKDTTNNIIAGFGNNTATHGDWSMSKGRWPANVLFDEEAAAMLDEQTGDIRSRHGTKQQGQTGGGTGSSYVMRKTDIETSRKVVDPAQNGYLGGPSRYFYVAKASKRERNAGLEDVAPKRSQGARPNSADPSGKFPDHDHRERGGNNHPTVKPIKLMEYLCKLITPPKGIILDPFLGSGTTGVAATRLGFEFIGIEREIEYLEISKRRISWASEERAREIERDLQLTLRASGNADIET